MKGLPGHLTLKSFDAALSIVRAEIAKPNPPSMLVNWLKHKDANPWVFKCLCYPLTSMKPLNWIETSFTTNIVESVHALSHKYGTRLTLLGAIEAGKKSDSQYFQVEQAVQMSGVHVHYGNNTATGRAKKSLNRKRVRMEAIKKAKKNETTEQVLKEAKALIEAGLSADTVEKFLDSKSKSSE